MSDASKLTGNDQTDPLREHFIALYDDAPPCLRPVLVAALELAASKHTGKEPRPGANEQNLRLVTEFTDQARQEGRERLADLLEGLLDPKKLLTQEAVEPGEISLDQHLTRV
jgi:hypothetical protein